MTKNLWLALLCGLLLAFPVAIDADPGPASGGSGSQAEPPGGAKKGQAEYEAGHRALQAGDYKKAIKSLEQVVKVNPTHAMAYNNLGYSYRKLGQHERALQLYEKALALDPNLAEAHEYIGEAYLALGRVEDAKKHLTILEKLDPKLAEELRAEIARHQRL